ncbi:MAG: hypothetical protein JO148_01480 [Acidimicrobiia bacterium]|nr:hypothetical protein [Acidimicrobiia bacterium]
MASKPPPSREGADPEDVSFSWPGQQGQRKRQDPGVLEARVAQRRQQRQQQSQPQQPAPEPEAAAPAAGGAGKLPARREDVSPSGARDRWIVTELRRQAVATEGSLRDINERLDQLGRTLRQVVDYLPRLQQRTPGGLAATKGQPEQHADAVLSQRIDELEARLEARFDELAGAASSIRSGGFTGGRVAPPVDTEAIKAQVQQAIGDVGKQLTDMGERLRAELVTAAAQAEARLNRDRDQLRESLNQTTSKLNELTGGGVTRDDLRQYWVEMAARLAKQQEVAVSEREQLRQDMAERLDRIAAEREQLRIEVGERLARVAEAASVRDRGTSADTKPLAAASAAQKAAIDELRRELHQLGAQLLAAANPNARKGSAGGRSMALDATTVESIKASMAEAASALASAASKDDVEALRNQLAGTVTRLEKTLVSKVEEDQAHWEEQLATALEAVRLAVDGVELNRQAVLAEVSAAVRAAMMGVLPPLAGSS